MKRKYHGLPLKPGPRAWWVNDFPRLEPGQLPHAALDKEGELVLTETTQDKFFSHLPNDGYSTSLSIHVYDDAGRYKASEHYTLVLGLLHSVALMTYPRTAYYIVGCDHRMEDVNSYDSRSRGHHKHVCQHCGVQYQTDSSD